MIDEEIRQALNEVREMKKMCGNINMKLTNIVTQRGQDFKKKFEAEYQRGLEDGKAVNDKGCEGCKYEEVRDERCRYCANGYSNQWTAKDDKIEVGDEVEWDGDKYIVTYLNKGINTREVQYYDMMGDDGSVVDHVSECAITKTGRHFDIQSILEDMRHDS